MVMYHAKADALPAQKDATVNDRDRVNDILASEKYLGYGYSISMAEASHKELFEVLRRVAENNHNCQREIWTQMFNKGWYKVPVADGAAVTHAFDQFKQYKTQLPHPVGAEWAQVESVGQVPQQLVPQPAFKHGPGANPVRTH